MKKGSDNWKEIYKIRRPKSRIKSNMKFFIREIGKWINF